MTELNITAKVWIANEKVATIRIRQLNPNKATGSDGISPPMLLLCDESVVLPLKIFFNNILSTAIFPDIWKLANVTPHLQKR